MRTHLNLLEKLKDAIKQALPLVTLNHLDSFQAVSSTDLDRLEYKAISVHSSFVLLCP